MNWRVAIIALVVATGCGGLIGILLITKDRVKRHLARGRRVNPFIRAYLGMVVWSLVLWCPTILFVALVVTLLTL